VEDEGAKASAVEAESARKAAAAVENIMMMIEMTRGRSGFCGKQVVLLAGAAPFLDLDRSEMAGSVT
jgi:hypothetical protein